MTLDEVDHCVAVDNDEILRREVEQLRADATTKSGDLEEQRLLVRRLTNDFEVYTYTQESYHHNC